MRLTTESIDPQLPVLEEKNMDPYLKPVNMKPDKSKFSVENTQNIRPFEPVRIEPILVEISEPVLKVGFEE